MADTGWINFSSAADDATVGSAAWTAPTNALASDDARATAGGTNGGGTPVTINSHYLKLTDTASLVPGGSTILGVEIQVERRTNNAGGKTQAIKLVKNGAISGTAKGPGAGWTSSDATETWGSASDLWGLTLTADDVNAANFGVVLQSEITLAPGTSGGTEIDHIQVRITYQLSSAMFLVF